MNSRWTLQLNINGQHCLRLLHPKGQILRCWYGSQAYIMLGNHHIRNLLQVEELLQGRTTSLRKSEVSELLLFAARIAIDLEHYQADLALGSQASARSRH